MSHAGNPVGSSIVAVYPDHPAAEHAVRLLHESGFALADLSIVGRDFQTSEEPVGFVSAGDYATAGAKTGAWFGGLFGLVVGAAFLVLPGVGPVIVAGPLSAAVVAGLEGALAGTALGSLAGALVGWGVPKERALKYETQVKGGKFLVIVRGNTEVISRARTLLDEHSSDHISVYKPSDFSL
jgi:tetrahydromethanopterin S-methyltransferase subunit G